MPRLFLREAHPLLVLRVAMAAYCCSEPSTRPCRCKTKQRLILHRPFAPVTTPHTIAALCCRASIVLLPAAALAARRDAVGQKALRLATVRRCLKRLFSCRENLWVINTVAVRRPAAAAAFRHGLPVAGLAVHPAVRREAETLPGDLHGGLRFAGHFGWCCRIFVFAPCLTLNAAGRNDKKFPGQCLPVLRQSCLVCIR